jgi:hypothetical protein
MAETEEAYLVTAKLPVRRAYRIAKLPEEFDLIS